MKSITIHNLEDPLNTLIRKRAKRQRLSLNKTIKILLEEALGIHPGTENSRRTGFKDLSGIWSEKDFKDFTKQTKGFSRVDPGDWR